MHVPLLHAWLVHGVVVVPHVPPDPHVCTELPEHCLVPAVQVPAQMPIEQVELVHGTAVP
jgi:hypothetical protein